MRYVLLLVLSVLSFMHCKAQSGDPSFQNLINVGTVSPEAASLGKFGNIPVSNCTGVPGITIPIFEINIGKTKLPISLDYHAGGIRVDETSSCVGTGWALNGIATISRTMVGLPDESSQGYLNSPTADNVYLGPGNYFNYVYNLSQSLADAEPDIFQYNINGQNGKFIFKNNAAVMQIPVTNNRIVGRPDGTFTITDANGTQYILNQTQITLNLTQNTIPTYINTWRVTKMVDANGVDTLYFTYSSGCNDTYRQSVNFSYTIGLLNIGCMILDLGGGVDQSMAWYSIDEGAAPSSAYAEYANFDSYLQQITWRGGQINFIDTCDRQDVTGSGQRLKEVDVYANQNGTLQQIKRVALYQSYFYSNPIANATPTEKNYRLRLDSVANLPLGMVEQPELYRMVYNSSPIAPRESYAQDTWGFNNGNFSNGNLMPEQSQAYNGSYYTFGNANRSADSSSMLACTLQSIQYPTKGKSVFAFEPHLYNTQLPTITPHMLQAAAYGSVQSGDTVTFTVDPNAYAFSYNVYISAFDYPDVTDRPRAILTDLTTGTQVFFVGTLPTTATNLPYSTGTQVLTLTRGDTYQLAVNIYTATDPKVELMADINWIDSTSAVPNIVTGGGLRVKSVTNYDYSGRFINEDLYQYGTDGTGVALTPQFFQDINFEDVVHREGCPGGSLDPVCKAFYEYLLVPVPGYSVIYHANSVFPTSQYSGSPVLYRQVTKYQVDSAGNPNGKTVYNYQVYQDTSTLSDQAITSMTPNTFSNTGVYLVNNTWKNGCLTAQQTYQYKSSGYQLQDKKLYTYTSSNQDYQNVLKINPVFLNSGCEAMNPGTVVGDFKYYEVAIQTGAMLMTQETDSSWDNNGNFLASVHDVSYNTGLLPVQKQTINSKGETLTDSLKYPTDWAGSGNVYQTMVNRNIIAPVVQAQRQNNGSLVDLADINYNDWFGNGNLLLPRTVAVQTGNFPLDTRIQYNQYDMYGNILDQQKTLDVHHSYIWDYQSVYPIAEVLGAGHSDIAYTSFEADGSGNWTIPDTTRNRSVAMTGGISYNLNGGNTITASGLNSSLTYVVSYWSTNGPLNVNGTSGTAGTTVGAWTYYEHQVTGAASVSVSGSATIDELRLFPQGAQMTTYAYTPLVGMTSQCTPTNYVTYYNYDGLNRLASVKDMRGNIIKTYNYHYESQ